MSNTNLHFVFSTVPLRFKVLLIFVLTIFVFGDYLNAQQGLKAEYYDGVELDQLVAVRYVSNIDESWDRKPPVADLNPHYCSIRWTGKIKPGKSGNYIFDARVDDGIRVWIGNQLIINQWDLNDVGIFRGSIDLMENLVYDIKIEYFNALNEGEIRLLWTIPTSEKSWYEYIFGGDDSAVVIAPEYFLRPYEPDLSKEADVVNTDDESIISTPKKPEIKQPKKVKPAKKKKQNIPEIQPITKPAPVAPKPVVTAKVIEKFTPKNIAFEQAKIVILESSFVELNLFADFMLDHPQLNVMIEGHTDPKGDADSNLVLSQQRAYKIAHYLVEKGIDNNRIKTEGFGGSQPLFVPADGSYYPANRRVVFIVSGWE